MDHHSATFLQRADVFTQRIGDIDEEAWAAPSPCEGWSAADIVDHVIDTQRDLFAGRGVDLGQRPGGGPARQWAEHLKTVRRVVANERVMLAPYESMFGPTTLAKVLHDFYGFDLIVHAWDINAAVGRDLEWSEEETETIGNSIPSWGDALYAEGICKPALDVPGDAPRQTKLLAALGRRAG